MIQTERIRRALLSVSDKTGIIEFARGLAGQGIELVASGGTRKLLIENGIDCRAVEEITSFPEMMGGRIKTLHPRILGGILARREVQTDLDEAAKHDIPLFDLIVVNLYPFQKQILSDPDDLERAVEKIDIGGPTMVRAAAKSFKHVAVVVDPSHYPALLEELEKNDCSLPESRRLALSSEAFRHVSIYDSIIARHLDHASSTETGEYPAELTVPLVKVMDLRYGENPHQDAAFYRDPIGRTGWTGRFDQLWGKELSTNNILDADSAWRLLCDLGGLTCVIIKHNNPCGVGRGENLKEAYEYALRTDPVSAFGGIVAVNREVDDDTAALMAKHFFEVIMAPGFSKPARDILEKKKNLRLLAIGEKASKTPLTRSWDIKSVEDGAIVQERDLATLDRERLKVVTAKTPTEKHYRALEFAWVIAKHVKSNAIVLAMEEGMVGVGAGQMSRVDSVRISIEKARISGLDTAGSVLASDAFFPFRDGIDTAAEAGVEAVIEPGGSIRDEEVIQAADEHGMAMVFTGMRHFRH